MQLRRQKPQNMIKSATTCGHVPPWHQRKCALDLLRQVLCGSPPTAPPLLLQLLFTIAPLNCWHCNTRDVISFAQCTVQLECWLVPDSDSASVWINYLLHFIRSVDESRENSYHRLIECCTAQWILVVCPCGLSVYCIWWRGEWDAIGSRIENHQMFADIHERDSSCCWITAIDVAERIFGTLIEMVTSRNHIDLLLN